MNSFLEASGDGLRDTLVQGFNKLIVSNLVMVVVLAAPGAGPIGLSRIGVALLS